MRAPEFWTKNNLSARALGAVLSPLGALYGLSVRLKEKLTRQFRPRARVICVGNLTVGGTGKTPVAMALGRMLTGQGYRVVFLTRGYGGRAAGPLQVDQAAHSALDVGDEPLLLAAIAPTIVARDRAKGAALADALGAEIIVMDDGFQNFAIAKDLSLIVVDTNTGFGNRRLVPAGPLREWPRAGLSRAHAVVLIGGGDHDLRSFEGAILRARIELGECPSLAGRKVFAFCGIGQPEKFFRTLAELGATLVGKRSFPDHHHYSRVDIEELKTRADALGAHLVTTEKDFVRLDAEAREGVLPVPVRAVFDDVAAFTALLKTLAP
jgi:tetraacyldisaccharide 4'-kinase